MKDIKKFLIAALSFMLLVSVSCSNDNKTGSGEETIYNVVGTWVDDNSGKDMIEVKLDGSAIYYGDNFGSSQETIDSQNITVNGNIYTANIPSVGEVTVTFTSDTTGTAQVSGQQYKISKKQ